MRKEKSSKRNENKIFRIRVNSADNKNFCSKWVNPIDSKNRETNKYDVDKRVEEWDTIKRNLQAIVGHGDISI